MVFNNTYWGLPLTAFPREVRLESLDKSKKKICFHSNFHAITRFGNTCYAGYI